MTDSVFDVALEKRFADSEEIATINVSSADTLLIRDSATGSIMRLSFATLTSAISSAFSASFATLIDGKVPASQLPSYVDDVLEYANIGAFPATGETGKIYIALDTNKTYRWSGSTYIYITSGAVDSVAGKTGVVSLSKSDVGLSNVDNTSDLQKNSATATLTNKTLENPAITGITDLGGGRIKFPGTQEASSDGTTLDDYRENGYSPTVATESGSLASYDISAQFTKIGRFVIVQGRLTISDKGNANGSILISLPYTPVFQRGVGMVAEIAQTGKTGKALIYGTDNNAYLTFYDNTFLTVSGYDITFNISYWTN